MEETKKYEGSVFITASEYRELITEAATYKSYYESERDTNWEMGNENRKLKEELDKTKKKLAYFVSTFGDVEESYWNK